MSAASVFVCYRRDDSAPYAGRLTDRLVAEFGRSRVFIDIDHIDYGDDFTEVLGSVLNDVSVVLVLVGPRWHELRDEAGVRRIDREDDYVRVEIETSLARHIRVIPVLVGGAKIPQADKLPPSVHPFVRRQAAELTDHRFNDDAKRLIESIKRRLPVPGTPSPEVGKQRATPSPPVADPWTTAGRTLRDQLPNWMVIIPLLAAVLVIPQGLYLVVQSTLSPQMSWLLLLIALVLELVANISVHYHRRRAQQSDRMQLPSPGLTVWLCVVPVVAASGVLSFAGLGFHDIQSPRNFWSMTDNPVLALSVVWCVVVPVLGWLFGGLPQLMRRKRRGSNEESRRAPRNPGMVVLAEFSAVVFSGLITMFPLVFMIDNWLGSVYARPGLYVMLVLPALLGLYLLGLNVFTRALFVGALSLSKTLARNASLQPMNDADRKWWDRLSRWILMVAVSWVVVTGLSLQSQYLLEVATFSAKAMFAVAAVVSGVAMVVLSDRQETTSADGSFWRPQRIALIAAVPIFAVSVFLLISWITALIGGWIISSESIFFEPLTRQEGLANTNFRWFWALPVMLLGIAVVMGAVVGVYRSSPSHGPAGDQQAAGAGNPTDTETERAPIPDATAGAVGDAAVVANTPSADGAIRHDGAPHDRVGGRA